MLCDARLSKNKISLAQDSILQACMDLVWLIKAWQDEPPGISQLDMQFLSTLPWEVYFFVKHSPPCTAK